MEVRPVDFDQAMALLGVTAAIVTMVVAYLQRRDSRTEGMQSFGDQLGDIGGDVKEVKSDLKDLKASLDGHSQQLSALSTRVEGIETRLSRVETRCDQRIDGR